MKANELMIGDWVQIVSDAPIMANEYHRIDWIRTGEVGLDNRKIVTYPYIQPIPLTAEILEKNGFGYYSIGGAEQWLIKDDYYDIKVYEWSDSIWVFKYDSTEMHIPHTQITLCNTHELQHALRLCGIEKEIEL